MVSVTRPAVCMQQVLSAHIMELYVKKVSTVTREKKNGDDSRMPAYKTTLDGCSKYRCERINHRHLSNTVTQ